MLELQYFQLNRSVILILRGKVYITAIIRFLFLIPYPCQSQQME